MNAFLNDLWNDLRSKRLWPVAVALLAGLIAVPVVLSKSSEKPSAPAPVASEARKAPEPKELRGLANVKLDGAAKSGSPLDTFDPSNPFLPPKSVLARAKQQSQAGATSSGPGSTAATSGSTGSTGSAGGTGSTGTTGPNTGGTGGGDQTKTKPKTTTTQYTYVVDVTFSANERTRHIKGMQRLEMLPNETNPLLLFMGVDSGAGNAVFLVDSSLTAAGEGKCKPSPDKCAFAYVGPGAEEQFTNDKGDTYRVRIDEIRKVKVPTKSQAARSSKHAKAGAAVGHTAVRRFVPPILSDLVVVATGAADDSKTNADRR
jgi:hypothetical protein